VESEVRDAFGEWLQTFNWEYFITITFREPRLPHHALSTVREAGKLIRRHASGLLFLGTELHDSRTLHMHGLLETGGRPNEFLASVLWRQLFERFGRSQVRPVQSREAVSNYVSKYVTKRLTEWDMW